MMLDDVIDNLVEVFDKYSIVEKCSVLSAVEYEVLCNTSSYWCVVNDSLLVYILHDDILFRDIFYDINSKRSIIFRRLGYDINISVDQVNYIFVISIR